MIQRRQSIYLLAVAIICAILIFADVVYYKETGNQANDSKTYQVSVDYNSTESGEEHIGTNDPLVYFLAATGLLALVSIFMYNKRKLQSKLVLAVLVLGIVTYVFMYRYSFGMGYMVENVEKELTAGAFVPLSILLFAFLAYRGINRDEKLVRSLDRIR